MRAQVVQKLTGRFKRQRGLGSPPTAAGSKLSGLILSSRRSPDGLSQQWCSVPTGDASRAGSPEGATSAIHDIVAAMLHGPGTATRSSPAPSPQAEKRRDDAGDDGREASSEAPDAVGQGASELQSLATTVLQLPAESS